MQKNQDTYIILLRGVMPVGKNKVPMAELRDALSRTKLQNVRTYIQTGNIIASTELNTIQVEQLIYDTIKNDIGADITVIARKAVQFKRIIELNPFKGIDTSKLYYSIPAAAPDPEKLKNFSMTDFSPEKVEIIENVIYTLYASKYSDSKFQNNFYESKLKVPYTTRNNNTMLKLMELVG